MIGAHVSITAEGITVVAIMADTEVITAGVDATMEDTTGDMVDVTMVDTAGVTTTVVLKVVITSRKLALTLAKLKENALGWLVATTMRNACRLGSTVEKLALSPEKPKESAPI